MAEEPEAGQFEKGESINLQNARMEDVFAQLRCTREGLSEEEASRRIKLYGFNKLAEHRESKILKFLGYMWNPLSWVMEAAAFLAIGLASPPDWYDFGGIMFLLLANATISFIEENAAGNAAAALMDRLAPTARVLRDGRYKERDAADLVPGDIITIKLGDIIPADARLLEGDPLKIDQSALTGESLLATKFPSDEIFSGSVCKQGEIEAIVIATGIRTFFGKAANLVETTEDAGHFQKVLTNIGAFCICSIAIGLILETTIMFTVLDRSFQDGINNLLVLLIGGIPIAMPTVLSITMAIGSNDLSKQGAIVKRITAIEEMAGMDILCSDKTGTLTLNKLTVDKSLVEVLVRNLSIDDIILLAARASRIENSDAIDTCVVGMLKDPKEARANIKELHFFPFNPVDKRTAITYLGEDGKMYRASKGAPEQMLALVPRPEELESRVQETIRSYADHGLRSLGVCRQEIPDGNKDGPGGPWEMVGLLPLYDPPRHDSAETIRQALELGVKVKMITGDQLAIAKETGRRLGMGSEMYPSTDLFSGKQKDPDRTLAEIIEDADGFAGVFPEHKYAIVAQLQNVGHIVGMTGDGVNDAPALKKANIGIAVDDSTDAARGAADIVLTEPGLSVIISAVLTARCIFQRMKNYTIYATSITIRIVLGFMILTLVWNYDFSPFMTLVIAILNDGTILAISTDIVKPSRKPDSWKLKEIFVTGIAFGIYLALTSVAFYSIEHDTSFFQNVFGVADISDSPTQLTGLVYLQVSISSQYLIFVTRSHGYSLSERPGTLLLAAFIAAQLIATLLAVYADLTDVAGFAPIGWPWAGVVWIYSLLIYIPLDFIKFGVRRMLNGRTNGNGRRDRSRSPSAERIVGSSSSTSRSRSQGF